MEKIPPMWNNPILFADKLLGIRLHPGQIEWVNNATKRINILRPGNRWGKTLTAAVLHIWQCMCKPNIAYRVKDLRDVLKVEYQTLNFGPTYELGRGALILARDIVQGNLLLPDGTTNKSLIADWAILNDRSEAQVMPFIEFASGSRMLGRSYSEMGVAFKMKALAFVTGDECADIGEIWTFTNNTLLPRVVDLNGMIQLVGTPQPEGIDYMRMIEAAQEDMAKPDWKTNGMMYTQRGSMYDNPNLPKEAIEEIERVADPVMREQIIRGEYVETGEKYFGYERVRNGIDKSVKLIEEDEGGRYVTGVDFAGGESAWADYTVIMTVDYSVEPYKVVYFNRFKGGDMSIPAQYHLVEDVVNRFHSRLVIDSSALGGKNALAFLHHLNPVSIEFGPMGHSTQKAEMLATLKITLDGGNTKFKRQRDKVEGEWVDLNPEWGLIRYPDIPELVNELQNYKLDDKKIRTDCVMCLAMIISWLEMRRPKVPKRRVLDFDFLGLSNRSNYRVN